MTNNIPLYRPKIDIQGNYAPFSGYTIISHAVHPLPKPLIDLVEYLSSSDLQKYYSFLPASSYHVTINPLDNVEDRHVPLLQEEQLKLTTQNTSSICTVENLLRSNILLLKVQFKDDSKQFANIIQTLRTDRLIKENILRDYTMFWHLTLAYQYKDIENETIKTKLDQIIENIPQTSKFPFDITLDQIRICSYENMTKFTAI